MTTVTVGTKTVELFENGNVRYLFLMHGDHGEGRSVWEQCRALGVTDAALAVISGIAWNDDLSPWAAPAVFAKGAPFAGEADRYLKELEEDILPEILHHFPQKPEKTGIVGYSLAGLFALYCGYRTDLFDSAVCASASFWYPEFLAFTEKHALSECMQSVYVSLGDKEAKTKNPVMRTVQDAAEQIVQIIEGTGRKTIFEQNPGGHFQDDDVRTAKGIAWILDVEERR